MQYINYVTVGLILAGALILFLAILKTRQIFKLLTLRKFQKQWRNLFILMVFFFVGYIWVISIVIDGESNLLLVLTGIIFFFGAVFVYLVVLTGFGTFKRLQELNEGLENKLNLLSTRNEELTQFSYATSHDLQEPLNTLLTSVNYLQEAYGKDLSTQANKFIHYTVVSAERMRELILGLSRYLRVGRERNFTKTDLNVLVEEVLDEIKGTIDANGAQIKIEKLPVLLVNPGDIKRVFQNLVGNAIKYRRELVPPEISITAEKKKGEKLWLFQVKDNGIGFHPKHSAKVFTIFTQLHQKNKYEGMGVGLAICKKVVELHGGSIWPESQVGTGTTFYFTLKESKK